jgi:hypothetical protein
LAKSVATLRIHNENQIRTHDPVSCSTYHSHHRHDVRVLIFALGNTKLLARAGTIAACPNSAHYRRRERKFAPCLVFEKQTRFEDMFWKQEMPGMEARARAPYS